MRLYREVINQALDQPDAPDWRQRANEARKDIEERL